MLDREAFEPVLTGVAIVKTAFDLYGDDFRWKDPPYEYVYDRNPFDVISGTSRLRELIEERASLADIEAAWKAPLHEFMTARDEFLLY